MKTAILVPLGFSPQILTEVIYLINQPDYLKKNLKVESIEIFTTDKALNNYKAEIFQNELNNLYESLNIKPYKITENIVKDQFEGRIDEPLDAYITKINNLQKDYDKVILVPTGGYRATSFQLSYVFTCLARETDDMFTICTDPNIGEKLKNFYYPKTDEQKNWLKREDIHFVPMSNLLGEKKTQVKNYFDVVSGIKSALQSPLVLDVENKHLILDSFKVKLPPLEMLIYCYICISNMEKSQIKKDKLPQIKKHNVSQNNLDNDKSILITLEEINHKYDILTVRSSNTLLKLKNNDNDNDLGKKISEAKSKINKIIKEKTNNYIANKIMINEIDENGNDIQKGNDERFFNIEWNNIEIKCP